MCDGRGNVATAAHGELEGLAPTGMSEAGAVVQVRHQRASTLGESRVAQHMTALTMLYLEAWRFARTTCLEGGLATLSILFCDSNFLNGWSGCTLTTFKPSV